MQRPPRRNNYPQQPEWQKIPIHFKEETYVDEAEAVIKEMKTKNFRLKNNELTTSQLRNLLKLTSALYDESQRKEFNDILDRVTYLRVQFVYQSGRNEAVKKLVELANILEILKLVQEKREIGLVIRFCRYMEALVAYFKYYGGKD